MTSQNQSKRNTTLLSQQEPLTLLFLGTQGIQILFQTTDKIMSPSVKEFHPVDVLLVT
jgi:hypothetical protein